MADPIIAGEDAASLASFSEVSQRCTAFWVGEQFSNSDMCLRIMEGVVVVDLDLGSGRGRSRVREEFVEELLQGLGVRQGLLEQDLEALGGRPVGGDDGHLPDRGPELAVVGLDPVRIEDLALLDLGGFVPAGAFREATLRIALDGRTGRRRGCRGRRVSGNAYRAPCRGRCGGRQRDLIGTVSVPVLVGQVARVHAIGTLFPKAMDRGVRAPNDPYERLVAPISG